MILLIELIFLFPIVLILTSVTTDRLPNNKNQVALVLAIVGAYALISAALLATDVDASVLLWNEAEFSIYNWTILGLAFQALAFHTAKTKWPLTGPNLAGIVLILIESLVHPYHWKAAIAFSLWALIVHVSKHRSF